MPGAPTTSAPSTAAPASARTPGVSSAGMRCDPPPSPPTPHGEATRLVTLSFAPAVTDFTREAQHLLRNPSHFKWYTVTLLLLVAYVYSVEIERRRWDIVLAGAALWLVDWVNEVVNALVLHFTHRAAIWTVTGDTSYL